MNAPARAFHPHRYFPSTPPGAPCLDDSDARLDLEESLSPRYSFLLGQHAGRLRLKATGQWPCDDLRRGYQDGLKQARQDASIHVRRLVALRISAFGEGLAFSSAITAAFLEEIDVPVCPVSGELLSTGTGGPADSTIARLDLRAGYLPGNVCVLARRIAELKVQYSLEDLHAHAAMMVRQYQGVLTAGHPQELSAIEALRLAAMSCVPIGWFSGRVGTLPPLASAPGLWGTPAVNVAVAHVMRAKSSAQDDSQRRLDRWFGAGGSARATSAGLVRHLQDEFRQGTHPCDVWLDPSATGLLEELLQALHASASCNLPPQLKTATALVRSAAAPLQCYRTSTFI